MGQANTYGLDFSGLPEGREIEQWEIELACLSVHADPPNGKPFHFWKLAEIIWGPTSSAPLVFNPWSEKIVECYYGYREIAVSGHSSSGKSDTIAALILGALLADPKETLIYFISTDKGGARKRGWSHIETRYNALPAPRPGKLYADGAIRLKTINGEPVSEKSGIFLVAGDKSHEQESVSRCIGIKNAQIIMCLDEAADLSHGLTKSYYGNIRGSSRFSKLLLLANFKSALDAFGVVTSPEGGFTKLDIDESTEWDNGDPVRPCHVLRLDALKSPNWLAKKNVFPFQLSWEEIQSRIDAGEQDTGEFHRFFRSFPSTTGVDLGRPYSEAEVLQHMRRGTPDWAEGYPIMCSGTDPAYTTGGDACIHQPARVGQCKDGSWAIDFLKPRPLRIDSTIKERGASYQISEQIRQIAIEMNYDPENQGVDCSDPGFMNVFHAEYSTKVFMTSFQGSATERITSKTDPRPNSQRFTNRVSEIWLVGLDFLRAGCLWNIPEEVMEEMVARQYAETDGSGAGRPKRRIEPKAKMKRRFGRSCDYSDAAFVLLDTVISRFKLSADKAGGRAGSDVSALRAMRAKHNIAARSDLRYSPLASRFPGMFARPITRGALDVEGVKRMFGYK